MSSQGVLCNANGSSAPWQTYSAQEPRGKLRRHAQAGLLASHANMSKLVSSLLLLTLGACASTSAKPARFDKSPSLSGTLPTLYTPDVTPDAAADVAAEKGDAPTSTTLPVGVGFTTSPASFLIAAGLDFPLDTKLTLGPSIEHSWDTNTKITSATAQLKLFLPTTGEGTSPFQLLPYLCFGAGFADVDKAGREGEAGFVVTGGAGVRFLTGEHYRIGSEARINLLPDKLDGESAYLSYQLLQVVIPF